MRGIGCISKRLFVNLTVIGMIAVFAAFMVGCGQDGKNVETGSPEEDTAGDSYALEADKYLKQIVQGSDQASDELSKWAENDPETYKQALEENMQQYLNNAENGDPDALNCLGIIYLNGYGVDPDYTESAKWFSFTAEQNNQYAQYWLGYLYDSGYLGEEDYDSAREWYELAAAQGNTKAREALERLDQKQNS